MSRRKITTADIAGEELPDLTAQQQHFVEEILAGKNATEAYRAAYDCSNTSYPAIRVNACRLRSQANIALTLSIARKAGMGAGVLTLANHVAELERIREIALDTGNVGAAAQCEQLRGKAMGHYTERMEVTDLTDIRTELSEIAKISPELAQAYAKEKGVNYH